ncbi:MAG: S-layer homology domain-containing protein, partial [Armatimonadetes bacterium]|nr:S-layer homology domain-containing protein [Armatimonadota bacterium]
MLRTLAAICVSAMIAAAGNAQARFTDLASHWAEPRITALASRGLLDPAAGPFRPEASIARATFLHWILATRGGGPTTGPASPSFPDVQPNDPSYLAVEAAVAAGILTPTGEPFAGAAPITREEAIGWIVRSADLAWEAEGFGHATIPAVDGAQTSPVWNGSVAVALLGRPALLREPGDPRIRPREPLTRAEAASLIWSYLQAAEGEFRLEQSYDIAGGVRLTTERRGILRNRPVWRVVIPT